MESLIQHLRLLQANAFVYYTKAHGYHWNVEGILFKQFHDMFSDLYEDLWESVDSYAEWIRMLGQYADFDISKTAILSNIKYDLGLTNNPTDMLRSLVVSNNQMLSDLNAAFNSANMLNEQGVANFFAERIDAHQKWGWKLVSSLKTIVNN